MSRWRTRLAGELYRRVAFPLLEPRDGWEILRALTRLQEAERWSGQRLREHREASLGSLLSYARRYSPWYGRVLREHPATLQGRGLDAMLGVLPVLGKGDVRAHGSELLVRRPGLTPGKRSSTGGSTGEPLVIFKSRETLIWESAALWRGFGWAGVRMGDRGVFLKASGDISRLGRLRARLFNTAPLSAFDPTPAAALNNLERIRRFAPRFLSAYVSPLLRHLEVAMERGQELLPTVPVIFTTGEMLYAHQREQIEEAFKARVFDYYGSNEIGGIAFECERGNKHVTDEHVIVEVVDEAGAPVWDRPGRIVVTDLHNRAMPMLRYEIGDMGALSSAPCPCGRPHTVLNALEGRSQDLLRAPGGPSLSAIYLAGRYRGLQHVRAYQLVQLGPTEVELRYVARSPLAEVEVQRIAADVERLLQSRVKVAPTAVEAIAPTARGKIRLVVGLMEGAAPQTPAGDPRGAADGS